MSFVAPINQFAPRNAIRRRAPEELLKLRDKSTTASGEAGTALVQEAAEYGLPLDDFLAIAIDPKMSADPALYRDSDGFIDGYAAALQVLEVPLRDDVESAKFIELASDTFATFPGVRALFPYVVDDMLQWSYRQSQYENTAAFVSQSRTINGTELLSTVVNDQATDYQSMTPVAELGRVRIKTITASEKSVKFYKHGFGYEMSYEFNRRAKLDFLTPYLARALREVEMSKVGVATTTLINGDGVAAAANEVDQSSFNGGPIGTATNGTLSWKHLLAWLVARAQAGYPVDTVVGNWNAYIQWLFLFSVPTTAAITTDANQIASAGFSLGGVPLLGGKVNFALSSTAPANKLIGLTKAEAIEELKEANSLVTESEKAIKNQAITYVRTENTGYRIIFPSSREIFDFGN